MRAQIGKMPKCNPNFVEYAREEYKIPSGHDKPLTYYKATWIQHQRRDNHNTMSKTVTWGCFLLSELEPCWTSQLQALTFYCYKILLCQDTIWVALFVPMKQGLLFSFKAPVLGSSQLRYLKTDLFFDNEAIAFTFLGKYPLLWTHNCKCLACTK